GRVRRRPGLAGDPGQHRRRRPGGGRPGQVRRRLPRLPPQPLRVRPGVETLMGDTMRSPFLRAAAWALFLALPAAAASPPQLGRVRIGLPGGQDGGRSRNSTWAPVYVPLQAGPEGNGQDSYRIVIETADVEDAPYRYTVPVPALSPNERRTVLSYVHPGSDGSEFTVKLQTADGQAVQALPRTPRDASRGELVGPRDVLFLALGSRLPTLKRTLVLLDNQAQEANKDAEADIEDRGSRRFASLDS